MTEDDDRAREFDAAPTVLEIGPLSPIPEAFVEETTAPSGIVGLGSAVAAHSALVVLPAEASVDFAEQQRVEGV